MRRLPSFHSLRAFEAAARLRSFAAAADELHLTPSAVSHQVRQLEQHFQRALFLRRARGVEPSPDGARLLRPLSEALDRIEAACDALAPAPGASPALAVHCAPSFATQWLQPRLAGFLQRHPQVQLRLSSGAEPADLAARDDVDVAIAYGRPPRRPGVVVRALGRERIAPMAAPALLASAGDASDPAALLARSTLIDTSLSPVGWARWFELNGLPLPARPRPSFDRAALAIASAVGGVGVVLESTRLAERELARGTLAIVGDGVFRPLTQEIHFLAHRRADADRAPVRAFRDWLAAELGAGDGRPG